MRTKLPNYALHLSYIHAGNAKGAYTFSSYDPNRPPPPTDAVTACLGGEGLIPSVPIDFDIPCAFEELFSKLAERCALEPADPSIELMRAATLWMACC